MSPWTRRHGRLGGDGQVRSANIVMKGGAKSASHLTAARCWLFCGRHGRRVLLLGPFRAKLEKHQGNLTRAAVELAKDWPRTDARRLEAMLIAAAQTTLVTPVTATCSTRNRHCAIGSGAHMPGAAQALTENTNYRRAISVAKGTDNRGDMWHLYEPHRVIETTSNTRFASSRAQDKDQR